MRMQKRLHNNRLKYERELRGWPQQQVADLIGSTVANVSRWERGITSPYPYLRQRLCELFGKDALALGLIQAREDDIETPLPSTTEDPRIHDPAIPFTYAAGNTLVGRDQLMEQLKLQLCTSENGTLVALHGLPGVGKTALAIALVSDLDVRKQFRDGILWAGLGTQPDITSIFNRWGALFGISVNDMGIARSSKDWIRMLQEVIGTRHMLIVIDDVWDINDAIALMIGGLRCTYLLTTRSPSIAASFATQKAFLVPGISEENGVILLQRLAPEIIACDAEKVTALVHSVDALPLALRLAGRYLHVQGYHNQPRRLRFAMERLLNTEDRLDVSEPIGQISAYPSLPAGMSLSLRAAIAVSDQRLDEPTRQALRALSVFPAKPNTFSEKAALAVGTISLEMLDTLDDVGLIEVDESGRYMIHPVIVDYARTSLTNL